MTHGIQVVGARHGDISRLYTSHWVSQVSFDEPIVMASISPKHDTYPLLVASGRFSISLLAGDQLGPAQYFSYPGRKFRYLADEMVTDWEGLPVVVDAVAWMAAEVIERKVSLAAVGGDVALDHDLVFARVVSVSEGRLQAPALTYSSRAGWRIADTKAREPGTSVRDVLLARLDGLEPEAEAE